MVCLARILTDGIAVVSPVRDKVDAILADLRACKDKGKLSSGEASSFSGRLGWLSSSTYGRIGRAATQCLMQRSHEEAKDWNVHDATRPVMLHAHAAQRARSLAEAQTLRAALAFVTWARTGGRCGST